MSFSVFGEFNLRFKCNSEYKIDSIYVEKYICWPHPMYKSAVVFCAFRILEFSYVIMVDQYCE